MRKRPILHPRNRETLVQFRCPSGHHFTVPYHDPNPTDRDLLRQLCPLCSLPARWTAMDYHIEP